MKKVDRTKQEQFELNEIEKEIIVLLRKVESLILRKLKLSKKLKDKKEMGNLRREVIELRIENEKLRQEIYDLNEWM